MRGAVMRVGITSWLVTTLAVALGWCAAPRTWALDAEQSPSDHGYFSLDQLDAYLEMTAEYNRTRVRSEVNQGFARTRSQTNKDLEFQERLGFRLSGTVVDRSFLTFGGDLSFALTQSRFEEDTDFFGADRTDSDQGNLLQFDLRVNLFQGKIISGSVYGLRQDDRINRRFQPTLDRRRTGFGTSWYFAHDIFPMELTYDYLETDRTGNRDALDDEHFIESTLHYSVDWNITDHHRFKLSYEHAENKQEYQGLSRPFETTRDLFTLEHQLEFGRDYEHEFRTLVHWQEESGDFARDFFEIGPQLSIRHSDDLQTLYKYQFNRERYEGLDIETHRADFQLVHRMYTNLTTTLDLFGLHEDIEDDINTTQYGAAIDWQYNRKNRFGHLYANLALAYDTEEVDGDNGRRLVLNEAVTFFDPITPSLRNRNVLPGSIVVTDTGNRRLFRPGLDYLIFRQGNVTRLRRLRTGQIADGTTVWVDYEFATPAHGQLDTVRVDFSLEQRFSNGWTPYYRLSYRNQEDDVSTGFARRADRTNHHRMGATYEAKRYTLGAEYEIFDDTIDPYDAFHANGTLHVLQRVDHNLDASVRFSRLFFEGSVDVRNVTLIDVELDHRWRLSESLSAVERMGYRWEDDSVDGVTNGWDVSAGLAYAVGDLSCELTFDYDRLDLPRSEEDDYGVYLRVRREIPDVLASR